MSAESIKFEQTDAGIVLPVKARAGASRNGINGCHNGMLRVSVTQIAEKGKANQRLLEVIAKSLKLKKSQVSLLSGETSAEKKFLVAGITQDDLAMRCADFV